MICMFKALLSTDVFENFRNMCLKICELDPSNFFQLLDWHGKQIQKETEVKLDFLTDINTVLMTEKGIRGGICHSIYRYEKADNKYMKDDDKGKELSCIEH